MCTNSAAISAISFGEQGYFTMPSRVSGSPALGCAVSGTVATRARGHRLRHVRPVRQPRRDGVQLRLGLFQADAAAQARNVIGLGEIHLEEEAAARAEGQQIVRSWGGQGVERGEAAITSDVAGKILDEFSRQAHRMKGGRDTDQLTERETEPGEPGAPKVVGRIVTTLPKAKEVRVKEAVAQELIYVAGFITGRPDGVSYSRRWSMPRVR